MASTSSLSWVETRHSLLALLYSIQPNSTDQLPHHAFVLQQVSLYFPVSSILRSNSVCLDERNLIRNRPDSLGLLLEFKSLIWAKFDSSKHQIATFLFPEKPKWEDWVETDWICSSCKTFLASETRPHLCLRQLNPPVRLTSWNWTREDRELNKVDLFAHLRAQSGQCKQ